MLALYFFKPQILLSRWRSWPVCKLQGLSSAECSDDLGENWIEIRPPPAAVIQVPFYGYRLNASNRRSSSQLLDGSVESVHPFGYSPLIVKWWFGFKRCAGDYRFAGRWRYHLPGPITIGIRHSSK